MLSCTVQIEYSFILLTFTLRINLCQSGVKMTAKTTTYCMKAAQQTENAKLVADLYLTPGKLTSQECNVGCRSHIQVTRGI